MNNNKKRRGRRTTKQRFKHCQWRIENNQDHQQIVDEPKDLELVEQQQPKPTDCC